MRTFFISDTHFCDENIIKYENRPFADTVDMEDVLINNWNRVVKPRDTVFVLGDISSEQMATKDIIKHLKGHKILVMGNHDLLARASYLMMGFDVVSPYPIIFNDFYICSHAPVYLNDHMPYANIHGHIHSKKMTGGNYFNVSVECINYTPIDFEEIKKSFMKGK